MARLALIREKLKAVPHVNGVTSLADLRRPGRAVDPTPLSDWFRRTDVDPTQLADDVLDTYIYKNQFVGADRKTAALLIILSPELMRTGQTRETMATLRAIAGEPPYYGQVVGAPVLVNDFFDKMEEDGRTLTVVSVGVMGLVILVLFRNLRWVVLPMAVVFAVWVWMRAIIKLLGLELGFTSAMTTPLVAVIGIATTIHIAVRFREELTRAVSREKALASSFLKVFPCVFWTCMTTAVGFITTSVSAVAPVRDFGVSMAAASLLVGLACLLALPGGLLIGRASATPHEAPGEETLSMGLAESEHLVRRYSGLTVSAAVLAIAVAGVGLLWLKPETDFTKNFRRGSPVLLGYRFAEDRLQGAGLVGLSFDAPEKLSRDFLDRVRQLESRLRELPGVSKVIVLTDFLDFAKGTNPSPLMLDAVVLRMLQKEMPGEISQVWNSTENRLRIVLRVQEQIASDQKEKLLASIEAMGKEAFGDSAHPSGLYVLLVYLMDSLLSDQVMMFWLSSAGMVLCLSIAFGSLWLGTAAFIPNVIPIFAVVGGMGWVDLKVNAATAILESISMGLAVDFSILYIYRFLHELRSGQSFDDALAATHTSSGKAMVFTSLALMLGFSVLAFSNFLPTMQFGLLVSLAMAGGLMGNLILLPVLLTWMTPSRLRTNSLAAA
jgi:predicted RND superfamily exporter protein